MVKPPGNPLTLLIGRIVRMGAELEREMRGVWLVLVGPSPAVHLAPDNMGRLIEDNQEMLKHARLEESQRTAASHALQFAEVAWRQRNRAVHDIWDESDEDADFVRRQKPKGGMGEDIEIRLSMAEVSKTSLDLHIAQTRIQFLRFALQSSLPCWAITEPGANRKSQTQDDWDIVARSDIRPGFITLTAEASERDS